MSNQPKKVITTISLDLHEDGSVTSKDVSFAAIYTPSVIDALLQLTGRLNAQFAKEVFKPEETLNA